MQRITKVITLASLVCFAGNATAQTCLGRPYFSTGHIQLSGGAQFGNHATVVGGGVAVGKDRSFFVQGNVDHMSVDIGGLRNDPDGFIFRGAVGYQTYTGRTQICPILSGSTGKLDLPGDADLERSELELGVMLGAAPREANGFHFVPFGGLAVSQLHREVDDDDSEVSFGTDTYFPLTLGLGMHFNRKFAVVTDVRIPLDLGNGNPSLGIRAVFPVGGR